ncbi:hypothetical protein [Flavobacterium cerinum]|uniref:Uncharacterized protein n=1 Tax=Flavobacterium cerinum TaxID=2502784 RepID=A0A444HBZ4_9FLAO|nr:hypothetical protein [Flavobacterium cerinum]RWX00992.1 hypothetical protein EPI11_08195 [Flavobacterium cerinum]
MEELNVKVEELATKLDLISKKMHDANERITQSLELLTSSLQEVNNKVDKLDGKSNNNFLGINEKLVKMFEEIRKIGDYTRYEENQDLLDKFPAPKGKA